MAIALSYNAGAMRELKSDLFGTVWHGEERGRAFVVRDTGSARWWTSWLARILCRREASALTRLDGLPGTPRLLTRDGGKLKREWIEGRPMQIARPRNAEYFRAARALLARLHLRGVAHNDLAKEPNWLVTPTGLPALVDFQLALVAPRRGRLFRALAREDIRHFLKHKRRYCPQRLTARERRILATPAAFSRLWMATGKPAYTFVTRRIFGWADREGANDRRF
jgi:predicted Ser/Thr protein kinase